MCRMKMMISVDVILMSFKQQINSEQNSVQSVMFSLVSWCFKPSQPQRITSGLDLSCDLNLCTTWSMVGSGHSQRPDFQDGRQRVLRRTRERTNIQPWSHTTAVEVEVLWFREGSP